MTIYQLHEYGGQWEDRFDYIIGSYLKKERAEAEKAKAEENELQLRKKHNKCTNCPFLDEEWEYRYELLSEYANHCDEADLEEIPYGMDCKNYFSKWDDSYFKIEEVEVEE